MLTWLSKSDFFTSPASTRFHGNYEGGLLEHSLNVYDRLSERIVRDKALWSECENDTVVCKYTKETIAICGLLHDVCKVNSYSKGCRNVKEDGVWVTKETWESDELCPLGDHSDKSIIIIQQFMKLSVDEILAIRAHMGGFDNAFRGGSQFLNKIFDRSRLSVHLHLADMEATYLMEGSSD